MVLLPKIEGFGALLSCRRCKTAATKAFVVYSILLATLKTVDAWKQCSPEEGGGICPVGNTCCPTGTPGISSCIPGRERDPQGARGQCCDLQGNTGCAYGYECAVKAGITENDQKGHWQHQQHQQQMMCKRKEPHPESLNAEETPRYNLCRLPPSSSNTYNLQKFPINGFNAVYYSSMGSILPTDKDRDTFVQMQKFSSVETVLVIVHGSGRNADDYLCAGISTAEAISKRNEKTNDNHTNLGSSNNSTSNIENGKVLVIAPKFVADIDRDDRSHYPNTLYWLEHGSNVPIGHTWRYGADAVNSYSDATEDLPSSSSSSRSDSSNQAINRVYLDDGGDENDSIYGYDKTGTSSYAVMDRLLEYLIGSTHQKKDSRSLRQSLQQEEEYNFPKLKRVIVAGHSAGGQYVHRWSLLSSSPVVWGGGNVFVDGDNRVNTKKAKVAKSREIEMRMVVANPRSYCYPDNRRMIRTEKGITSEPGYHGNGPIGMEVSINNFTAAHLNTYNTMGIDEQYSYRFAVPDPRDVDTCPTYDQWQWGLEPGGDILCPYKDAALDLLHNNTTALALRYSKRKVFYLAGEHDTIEQADRCETYNFQGDNRNERARRYFRALTEYLATLGRNRTHLISTNSSKTTNLIHEFHQVPGSPHDHTLMFQSAPGREAFYGTKQEGPMYDVEWDDKGASARTASV